MHTYFYEGPVLEYDKVICRKWHGTTEAVSKSKARSNLAYQFKKEYHKAPRSMITLSGKIQDN